MIFFFKVMFVNIISAIIMAMVLHPKERILRQNCIDYGGVFINAGDYHCIDRKVFFPSPKYGDGMDIRKRSIDARHD